MPQNSTEKVSISKDIEALGKAIELPIRPIEAVWQEKRLGIADDSVPGPTDYRLVAILKFKKSEIEQLLQKKDGMNTLAEIEEWYPEEIKKLKNADSEAFAIKFDAADFYKPPFMNGSLYYIKEADSYILRLNTF